MLESGAVLQGTMAVLTPRCAGMMDIEQHPDPKASTSNEGAQTDEDGRPIHTAESRAAAGLVRGAAEKAEKVKDEHLAKARAALEGVNKALDDLHNSGAPTGKMRSLADALGRANTAIVTASNSLSTVVTSATKATSSFSVSDATGGSAPPPTPDVMKRISDAAVPATLAEAKTAAATLEKTAKTAEAAASKAKDALAVLLGRLNAATNRAATATQRVEQIQEDAPKATAATSNKAASPEDPDCALGGRLPGGGCRLTPPRIRRGAMWHPCMSKSACKYVLRGGFW